MERLSGVDTTWLRMETAVNPLTVTSIMWLREKLPMALLREKVLRDLLPFRRFRQRVAGFHHRTARPVWEEDPHFSLGNHLHHMQLPDGGERALRTKLSELMSRPLDPARPLWEAYLMEGAGGPGNALVTRIHHSLADGFSLILLLAALVDDPLQLPHGLSVPRLAPVGPRPRRDSLAGRQGRLALDELWRTLRHRRLLGDAATAAKMVQSGARLLTMPADSRTSFHTHLGAQKRGAWTRPVPLEAVKQRARACGATVNDLLLATLAGAFRRVLEARGEPTWGVESRAIVPVNVRPFEARRDVFGNGFGLVFLDLPVGLRGAAERLAAVKQRMDAIKRSPEAFVSFGLLQAGGYLPEILLQQLLALFHGKNTAVVTNVPGPIAPVRLAGVVVDDVVFFAPQSAGTGIGVSIFSYCGHVRVSIGADANVLPEPLVAVEAYHKELESLGIASTAEPSHSAEPTDWPIDPAPSRL